MEARARIVGKSFRTFIVGGGDHFTIVRPVAKLIAEKLAKDDGPSCAIEISQADVDAAFKETREQVELLRLKPPAVPEVTLSVRAESLFSEMVERKGYDEKDACVRIGLDLTGEPYAAIEAEKDEDDLSIAARKVRVVVTPEVAEKIAAASVDRATAKNAISFTVKVKARAKSGK